MKIVSFNINGLRAREHQLRAIRDTLDPDIIALQEIKVPDQDFPRDMVEGLGYQAWYHGQKAHYGVALLCRQAPLAVTTGLPGEPADAQRRLITGEFATADGGRLVLVNGYFPQGESRDHPSKFPHKRDFYAGLADHLAARYVPDQPLLVVGDMNVAPLDLDIGIGADNARRWLREGKCSFLPEEREWLGRLGAWGLQDLYRQRYPEVGDRFSWFDYRSRGFEREPRRGLRIDLILGTAPLAARVRDVGIDYAVRAMEKPSDHCPVWVDLDL